MSRNRIILALMFPVLVVGVLAADVDRTSGQEVEPTVEPTSPPARSYQPPDTTFTQAVIDYEMHQILVWQQAERVHQWGVALEAARAERARQAAIAAEAKRKWEAAAAAERARQQAAVARAAAPAPAPAPVPNAGRWDALAQCEANGNWQANTGNGYYGGLQFDLSSWRGAGGTGYPHEHSREEQIRRGEIWLAKTSWASWPHCSRKLGYR